MGKNAVVSIPIKYLHPSQHIRNAFPNPLHRQRLENCTVLRQEEKKINRRDQLAVVVKHDDFTDDDNNHIELYAVSRWFKVTTEGPSDLFFHAPGEGATADDGEEDDGAMNPAELATAFAGLRADELAAALPSNVNVNDDTQPAPENVPTANDNPSAATFGDWGHDGGCYRRGSGVGQTQARIQNFPPDIVPTYLQLFELLFPKRFVVEVIIPQTSQTT